MKKNFFIFFLIIIGVLVGFYFWSIKKEKSEIKKKDETFLIIKPTEPLKKKESNKFILQEKKSIFLPSWQLNSVETDGNQLESVKNQLNQYQKVIYFGEEGKLKDFVELMKTLQINSSLWFTFKISELPPKNQWQAVAKEKKDLLKKFNLQGIVLDLEISGLPTEDLISEISQFVQFFLEEIKKENFKNAIAIYGDVFYRKRPYDLAFLEKLTDEIMIMAYDFSKIYGEPGPNMPFEGKEKFGYDFKTMIDDFLSLVPAEKLTVIFGMYGYDWRVDEKKRPISSAKALTLNQIKEKFLDVTSLTRSDKNVTSQENLLCLLKDCLIIRHNLAKEVEISYFIASKTPDEQGIYRLDYHIVWFEDEKSVEIKTSYLKEKEIGSVAYWAWGYF